MRILVVSPTFLPVVGGAEIFVLEVCSRLAPRHQVRLLTPALGRKLVADQGSDEYNGRVNFEVSRFADRVNLLWFRGRQTGRGLVPPFSISCQGAARREISAWRPDVVQVYYVVPTGLAVVAAAKMRVPTVLSYVGRDLPAPEMSPAWRFWHDYVLAHATEVTYVSQYSRRMLGREGGEVTYVGVQVAEPLDEKEVDRVCQSLGLRPGMRLLFSLQRLDAEKRSDVVVRAMIEAARRRKDVAGVVGGKGPELDRLRALAVEAGVQDRVLLPGFLTDRQAAALRQRCDVFLFHSTYETFGIVLADAMACAKPVVSVFNTAIPEVVRNGEDGLLAPEGDSKSMAAAALRLLENDELRARLGASAQARTRQLFDWDHVAERVERALTRAARQAGA